MPAVAALSEAYYNGGAYMYGQAMIDGTIAVYGVLDCPQRGQAGTLYQAAIRRKDGQVEPAFDSVVGLSNVSAPEHVQDALAAFVTSVNDARRNGACPAAQ